MDRCAIKTADECAAWTIDRSPPRRQDLATVSKVTQSSPSIPTVPLGGHAIDLTFALTESDALDLLASYLTGQGRFRQREVTPTSRVLASEGSALRDFLGFDFVPTFERVLGWRVAHLGSQSEPVTLRSRPDPRGSLISCLPQIAAEGHAMAMLRSDLNRTLAQWFADGRLVSFSPWYRPNLADRA